MTFDLHAINKEVPRHSFNYSGWANILDMVGPLISCGMVVGGNWTFVADENGFRPIDNDGYLVDQDTARMFARYIQGVLHINQANKEQLEILAEAGILDPPCEIFSENWVRQLERFVEFCNNCGGFTID